MVDVIYIQFELLRPRDVVAAVHLRPTAHARGHVMTMVCLIAIQRKILYYAAGAGPDEGHVSLQYVDKLRQFIDRSRANEFPHLGQAVGHQATSYLMRLARPSSS